MSRIFEPTDDDEDLLLMRLTAAVIAEVDECDRKMATHIRKLFEDHKIFTVHDDICEADLSTRLNEAMMLMESIFSPNFSIENLFDVGDNSYRGVTRKLLMFAQAPQDFDDSTQTSIIRSIVEAESDDSCTVDYFNNHMQETSKFDICKTVGTIDEVGAKSVVTFRTLLREASPVGDAILSLESTKGTYIDKFGITLADAIRALRRWNDGQAPKFSYFPDFDRNMLSRSILLLTCRRILKQA